MGMTYGSFCETHKLSPMGKPNDSRKFIHEKLENAEIKPLDEKLVMCPYCAFKEGLREGQRRAMHGSEP